jgi:hypothetical protein
MTPYTPLQPGSRVRLQLNTQHVPRVQRHLHTRAIPLRQSHGKCVRAGSEQKDGKRKPKAPLQHRCDSSLLHSCRYTSASTA